ncbi:hypothetical protein FA048_10230 [Pedobacter polaris]|uniref:Aspartyl protease n=1 Tax=Pedobacter polaris TaxID=2571273 RepID=A0A4U1CTW2_9SPHI|nr:hypothetical protein [Pedobacter polaris]TKC10550.1 hypothetical protein FA048_10230 [Pedobacter polaris]
MHSTPKLLKRTAAICLLLITAIIHPSRSQQQPQPTNKLSLPVAAYKLKFKWQGDSVLNKWEQHSAILIPVKLKNCPKTFYMQFDLGSPYSLFYSNKLKAISDKYPSAVVPETPAKATTAINFMLHNVQINATEIATTNLGKVEINWKDKKSIEIIGTIGADLIDQKVLVIDYPGQTLVISPEIPSKLKEIQLTDFVYMRKSIMLPAKLNGKQTLLFFDTGSSRYSLLADQKTAQSLAQPNGKATTSKVSSWGRMLTANSLQTSANITIAGYELPIGHVTYMEGVSSAQVDMMKGLGIGGMTGNKLFLNYKLILDTKDKKFALVN